LVALAKFWDISIEQLTSWSEKNKTSATSAVDHVKDVFKNELQKHLKTNGKNINQNNIDNIFLSQPKFSFSTENLHFSATPIHDLLSIGAKQEMLTKLAPWSLHHLLEGAGVLKGAPQTFTENFFKNLPTLKTQEIEDILSTERKDMQKESSPPDISPKKRKRK
jgi:hypothetical protein